MTKIVIALGDNELNNAIKNNDLKTFITVCKKRNLLTKTDKSIFSNPYYQKQIKEANKKIAQNLRLKARANLPVSSSSDDGTTELFAAVIAIAFILVLAVSAVGVATFTAALNSVAAANITYTKTHTGGLATIESSDLSTIDIISLKETSNAFQNDISPEDLQYIIANTDLSKLNETDKTSLTDLLNSTTVNL